MITLKSKNFIIKQFAAGDVIAREGEKSDSIYIIIDGSVEIYKNYNSPKEEMLGVMGSDGFFGEKAFFTEKTSNETAIAQKNCSILALNRTYLYRLFMYEPDIAVYIFKVLFNEIQELYAPLVKSTTKELVSGVSGQKRYESNPALFFSTGSDFYDFTIHKKGESYFQTYKAQAVIVEEGEPLKSIYIVLNGSTGIFHDRKKIANIRPGNFISGANFLNGVATETFASIKETEMLVLTPENIEKFFKTEPKSAFAMLKMLCNRIELLINFTDVLKYGKQILPMNHKKYKITIKMDANTEHLQEKFFFCPICQNSFKSVFINTNKLLSVSADDDSRLYYDGVEPLFYDVITCPQCWYTALKDYFDKGMGTPQYFQKAMEPYRSMKYNVDKLTYNIDDVLLAYHFAVFCVNECFNTGRSLHHAKICLRLSWLYNICGDAEQEMRYTKKAREYFLAAFEQSAPDTSRQAMGLMIVMGVVCYKAGDKKNAKFFLTNVVLKSDYDEYKEKAKSLLKKYELILTKSRIV